MTQMTQIFYRRGAWAAAVLAAMIGTALLVLVPPAPMLTAPLTGGDPTVRGAYHIHSDRSDGSGSVDDIAAAAARAGLQFIIITDHGDGTRVSDVPRYRHGVLVIDAVELNTAGGHLVALGLAATPYPLAGTAADVLADVRRLGGFGIAAHPDSPRPSLRWTAWDVEVDGLEWINADSGWRDESGLALARAVLSFGLRPAAAMAALLDRPTDLLARWDAMGATQSVPALAAADAHARLGLRQETDPDVSALHLPLPGYEPAFRTFSNHVVLDQPLTGDGPADAAVVLTALKQGRSFTVVDALATPGGLEFTATGAGRTARMGDSISMDRGVELRARVSGPSGTTLRLLRNGSLVQETSEAELVVRPSDAGVYRLEARTPGAPGVPAVPWLLSNPIYVGLPRVLAATGDDGVTPRSRIPARTTQVTAEKGVGDVSELVAARIADARERRLTDEPPIGWRFALANGMASGQFAALQLPVAGSLAVFDRVRFTVKSASPVRAWVQLRAGAETERWGRTFYADTRERVVDLPLRSFLPIGATSTTAPALDRIDSLLLVVDTLNNRPGATGSMTIAEVAFVR
ncbi:MAG: hypothetical protein EXQ54_08705 [Acidobacteria bacterium]|nr:hypothetical protein [Acidobacteriota bacterium]